MKRVNSLFSLFCMCIILCNYSCKKHSDKVQEESSIDYETSAIKDFFIPYGEDSLLMIPDFGLRSAYAEAKAYKRYGSYQEFKREFLSNPKAFPQLLSWPYHVRINKKIMHDYHHMGFDDFWNKYLYVEGEDTLSSINDTTLAYCLDKHDFYSIFDYCRTGKIRVIKSEYPYEYSRIIEKQQERLNKYIEESSKLGNR